MNEQMYRAFVHRSLEDQMRCLHNGHIQRFCAYSNALCCVDKKYGTLMNVVVVQVKHGLYGLFVKQNKKCNQLKK